MTALVADQGMFIEIEDSTNIKSSTSSVNIILITFLSLFALIVVIGVVVDYTSLFDKHGFEKSTDDSMKTKTKIGQFFLAFSIFRNIE